MVSVILTTKNESAHIDACLKSLTYQTYSVFEVIVVDNGSRDKTREIAKRYTKHVFDAGPERSAQRNFGARKANGGYLLFLDADMILMPQVITACVQGAKRKNYKGIIIPEKSFGVGFWAQCKALEREYYEGVEWMEAARFFRTDVFHKLGGYDEHLTGPEDFELSQRLKAKYGDGSVGRIKNYILHNEGKLSLVKLIRKKYYYGNKMSRYRILPSGRTYFMKQANPFARYSLFFRSPARLLRDPVHAAGMLIMKTAEMGALACGSLTKRGHV